MSGVKHARGPDAPAGSVGKPDRADPKVEQAAITRTDGRRSGAYHGRQSWRYRSLGILALFLAVVACPAIAQQPPKRVVSINVCTDQLLIALAEPRQIAALSAFSRHPELSLFARVAGRFPIVNSTAEEVMALKPDLVLASAFTKRATRELLKRFGYPMLELRPAESFEEIRRQIMEMAEALGASERGAAIVATFDAQLGRAGALDRPDGPTALYYQRRGFASGAGTLIDAVMRGAGLRNLATDLGYSSVARMPLEQVVAAMPHILVVDDTALRTTDRGSELLAHPALARTVPRERWITIAPAYTVCGGPWLAEAVADMRTQAMAIAAREAR